MTSDEAKTLKRWNKLLIDETLRASDKEVLEAAAVIHEDPKERARNLRTRVEGLIADRKRQALKAARRQLDEQQQSSPPQWARIQQLSDESRRRLTHSITEGAGVTLAARQGKEITEADQNEFLRDALELGLITEDDLTE